MSKQKQAKERLLQLGILLQNFNAKEKPTVFRNNWHKKLTMQDIWEHYLQIPLEQQVQLFLPRLQPS